MPLSKRKKIILCIFGTITFIVIVLFLWAFVVEPNRLVVNETSIALPNLPTGLSNLKIVAISDIHGGSVFISESKLQTIVETANAQEPDLIFLLGDFVSQEHFNRENLKMSAETIAGHLKMLKAKHGVYAVLGNHDWWYNGKKVQKALEDVGIRVLENDVAELVINGQTLWILGVPDYFTRQPINLNLPLKKINRDGTIIAITHNPDVFPELPSKISLTLAGHTHGGQVNFPIVGAMIVPSQYGQRFAKGHIVEDNKHLFVTSGIGTSIFPVRFRVPPEIAVLRLSSQ